MLLDLLAGELLVQMDLLLPLDDVGLLVEQVLHPALHYFGEALPFSTQ